MAELEAFATYRFEPMSAEQVGLVQNIEARAHAHPWQVRHFSDVLTAGYPAQLLWDSQVLVGYFVAMSAIDEVHLLNLTVAPEQQRQGWGRFMLDALTVWSRAQGAQWLWLEVRASNQRARHVYEQYGLRRVGERKDYYPGVNGQRENAIVMSLKL